jgi:hypothetical protein
MALGLQLLAKAPNSEPSGWARYRSMTDLVPLAVATSSVGLSEIEFSQDVPIPNGAVSDSRPLVSIMSWSVLLGSKWNVIWVAFRCLTEFEIDSSIT